MGYGMRSLLSDAYIWVDNPIWRRLLTHLVRAALALALAVLCAVRRRR